MRLDEAAIQGFLATREVGVLATVQADGAPLAMPMWFLQVRGRLERLWNGRAMLSNRVMFRITPARVRGWGLG